MEIRFDVPFMTIAHFAEKTGLSYSYVRKRAYDGTYPILPKKHQQESTLINVVQLVERVQKMEKVA